MRKVKITILKRKGKKELQKFTKVIIKYLKGGEGKLGNTQKRSQIHHNSRSAALWKGEEAKNASKR